MIFQGSDSCFMSALKFNRSLLITYAQRKNPTWHARLKGIWFPEHLLLSINAPYTHSDDEYYPSYRCDEYDPSYRNTFVILHRQFWINWHIYCHTIPTFQTCTYSRSRTVVSAPSVCDKEGTRRCTGGSNSKGIPYREAGPSLKWGTHHCVYIY